MEEFTEAKDRKWWRTWSCIVTMVAWSTSLQVLSPVNGETVSAATFKVTNFGKLETANYPHNFDGNASFEWQLQSPSELQGISLFFDDFYLENEDDQLYLYEGRDAIKQYLHSTYKGNRTSTRVFLRNNRATATFSCNNTGKVVRFKISFTSYLMTTTMPTTTVNIELIDECQSSPCVNGLCVDEFNAFRCSCKEGFSGITCATDIDECASTPCLRGACTNIAGSYNCSCDPGFDGKNCSEDIDECSHSPCVHGSCTNSAGSYNCHCHEGYTGVNCSNDNDECLHNPCVNGNCTNLPGTYKCQCHGEYTGINCTDGSPDLLHRSGDVLGLKGNQTMSHDIPVCSERQLISDDGRVPWYFILLAVIISITVSAIWFFCCYMKLLEIRREQQLQALGLKSYPNHGFSTITLSAST